jgi:ribosomal protein S1
MKQKKEVVSCGNPDFDWDLYERSGSNKLVENTKIKKKPGDTSKVYCHEPYAQELYDLYMGYSSDIQEPTNGSTVEGTVTSVGDRFAMVNVNWREDIAIDLRKENPEYLKYIQQDFPIEIVVESGKVGKEKVFSGSYTKNIISKKFEELKAAIGEPVAYAGIVKSLVHGGYFVDIDGIEVFMPGSLGGMNKLVDFESLIGKTLYVTIINYSREKGYLVVSHREYLKSLIPDEIAALEFSTQYEGHVTGCSKHGIFVEFNKCLTGLISKSELKDELLEDFNNRQIKPGDKIEFYVAEIIDNSKISLSIEKPLPVESAWDDIEERYKIPSYVTGKIKRVVKYGVFIEIEPKIVGLLHRSQIEENLELEVGQEIDVKIVKIDKESKKVDFTM